MLTNPKIFEILLIEDNLGDVQLTREALEMISIRKNLNIVQDGDEAWKFLNQEEPYVDAPQPDIILLDLNLPILDGRDLLVKIKTTPKLLRTPVIVLTNSDSESDILQAYKSHANSYISKPLKLEGLIEVLNRLINFWFLFVKLPPKS